jgi:Ras-related protein Rab-7A
MEIIIQKKVAIMGEGGVGKTTLLHRYINGNFVDSTKMTIGSDFFTKNIDYMLDSVHVSGKMQIWDLGGQDRFRFMMKDYMKGSEAIILAYDLTRMMTLIKLAGWLDVIEEAGIPLDGSIPIVLLGTKKDLYKETPEDVEGRKEIIGELMKRCKIQYYIENSSYTGENVEQAFDFIINAFVQKTFHQGIVI